MQEEAEASALGGGGSAGWDMFMCILVCFYRLIAKLKQITEQYETREEVSFS